MYLLIVFLPLVGALLGAFVQLGWSKTGDPAELAWWTDRVVPTAARLGL